MHTSPPIPWTASSVFRSWDGSADLRAGEQAKHGRPAGRQAGHGRQGQGRAGGHGRARQAAGTHRHDALCRSRPAAGAHVPLNGGRPITL